VTITDSETWAHRSEPNALLRKYRAQHPNAKAVVVAVTSTEFTLLDPDDPRNLNYAGWSADVVDVVTAFSRV
jgi:60 kDa SS-A/Ro ribonucleoprotein